MASIYRPSFTRINPTTGRREKRKLRKWYVKYRTPDGRLHRVPGYTDKEATKQLAARLERKAARNAEGMVNPFEDHHRRLLTEHLNDFETAMSNATNKRGTKNTLQHVRVTVARARKVMDGCEFKSIADISADKVEAYISRLGRDENLSVQSCNFYLAASKQFCRWLVDSDRTDRNPLSRLKRGNVALDRRHDRRALDLDELHRVLDAARVSSVVFRGLTGLDRFWLYAVAMATGLRVSELASLLPSGFHVDSVPPFVRVQAAYTKNRQEVDQPLPPKMVRDLGRYLAGKAEGQAVWPGTWTEKAARMLRIDLDAAGVPYVVDGQFADFHALRHSYITLLGRTGASTKVTQELARHSDVRLTMDRYTHAGLYDLTAAVESLPSILPPPAGDNQSEALAATGTDAAHCPQYCPVGEISCVSVTTGETSDAAGAESRSCEQILKIKAFASDCDSMTTADSDYARQDSNLQPMVPKTIALSS